METGEKPLISVIVPVYNVKEYLERCVVSIVGQTYARLEIILVDDGSTDGSGELCDELANRDGRIRVVHKGNGGVATARNAGVEVAEGEYIGFVDSDDWIEPEMYEVMVNKITVVPAEIAVCRYFENDRMAGYAVGGGDKASCKLLSKVEAEELLIGNRIESFCWNKLFDASLFDGIEFPDVKCFEDVAVMYRIFGKASGVTVMDECLYHYCRRDNSLTTRRFLSDGIKNCHIIEECYGYITPMYPELEPVVLYRMKLAYCGLSYRRALLFGKVAAGRSLLAEKKKAGRCFWNEYKTKCRRQLAYCDYIQLYLATRGWLVTDFMTAALEVVLRKTRRRIT